MTQEPVDWKEVGRDGELILKVANPKDPDSMAVLYNEFTREYSEPQPLQVFFKWGNFVEIQE